MGADSNAGANVSRQGYQQQQQQQQQQGQQEHQWQIVGGLIAGLESAHARFDFDFLAQIQTTEAIEGEMPLESVWVGSSLIVFATMMT